MHIKNSSQRLAIVLLIFLLMLTVTTQVGAQVEDNASSEGAEASPKLIDATLTGTETIQTPYGDLQLLDNHLTDETSSTLFDVMNLQRASQAYMRSLPLVGYATWKNEHAKYIGEAKLGDFVVFQTLKEKRGIVTANLTTPYIISFVSLAKAPVLVDYPAGETAGGFMDAWQRPVSNMGLTGPDQGKGGKYIIIGPEDDLSKYQKEDRIVVQSPTNNLFIGLRLLNDDPKFVADFESSFKIAHFGEKPKAVRFIKGIDREWSATPPRGLAYWETLSEILSQEPVRAVDKIMMAMIAPLGIEKGKPFNPNKRQRFILKKGAVWGELFSRNIQTNPRFAEVYWPGTHWYKSFDFVTSQETDTMLQLDERTTWYYEAVTSSEGMINPEVGKGQVYMTSKRDSEGKLFQADKIYHLHVPAAVPVKQFWSLTLYSENTRRPYDNGGTEIASISLDSKMKQLQYNNDGSIDLYIGAKAPKGMESNFMKTVGDNGWFSYFRLYSPTEPFFDKSFSLPDFEEIEVK